MLLLLGELINIFRISVLISSSRVPKQAWLPVLDAGAGWGEQRPGNSNERVIQRKKLFLKEGVKMSYQDGEQHSQRTHTRTTFHGLKTNHSGHSAQTEEQNHHCVT